MNGGTYVTKYRNCSLNIELTVFVDFIRFNSSRTFLFSFSCPSSNCLCWTYLLKSKNYIKLPIVLWRMNTTIIFSHLFVLLYSYLIQIVISFEFVHYPYPFY